jgi:hypothetical protein
VKPALTLQARTADELDAISDWVLDSWLDGPVGPIDAGGTLRLTLTKDAAEVAAVDEMPAGASGLPQPRDHRVTRWYEEWRRPLVECTLTIRHAEEIVEGLEEGNPLFSGVEFDPATQLLNFDGTVVQVRVSELDVQLDVMPDAVGWKVHRSWQIGPIVFDTGDTEAE